MGVCWRAPEVRFLSEGGERTEVLSTLEMSRCEVRFKKYWLGDWWVAGEQDSVVRSKAP